MGDQVKRKSDSQMLRELHCVVFVKGAMISTKSISKRYQLTDAEAVKLLEDFITKYHHGQNGSSLQRSKPLKVMYHFKGCQPKNERPDLTVTHLTYVDSADLEQKKLQYESCKYIPYSVHLASKKPPKPVLFFTKLKLGEPTVENIMKVQESMSNFSFPDIKIRPPFRPPATKTAESKGNDAIVAVKGKQKESKKLGKPMDVDQPGPSTSKYFSGTSASKQQQKTSSSSSLKKRPMREESSSAKVDKGEKKATASFTALKAPPAKKAKRTNQSKSTLLDSIVDPCEKLRSDKQLTEQANFTVKKGGSGSLPTTTAKADKKAAEKTAAGKTGQLSILNFFGKKKVM